MNPLPIAIPHYSCLAKFAPGEIACQPLIPGWSGAESWQIRCPGQSYSLRAWPPEYPTAHVLAWQHAVLEHVQARHLIRFPRIQKTVSGASYFLHDGRLWELTEWIDGEPVINWQQWPGLVDEVFDSVAEFHRGVADFIDPFPGEDQPASRFGPPPGLVSRCRMVTSLLTGELDALEAAAKRHKNGGFRDFATTILAGVRRYGPILHPKWQAATELTVPVFPCWRDLRPEHLLFNGENVVGWLDFGSLRPDAAAADLSRFLVEMPVKLHDLQDLALARYKSICQLSAAELTLIPLYVESSRLLAGVNWVRWIAVEQREFPFNERLYDRWRQIRLHLTELSTV